MNVLKVKWSKCGRHWIEVSSIHRLEETEKEGCKKGKVDKRKMEKEG